MKNGRVVGFQGPAAEPEASTGGKEKRQRQAQLSPLWLAGTYCQTCISTVHIFAITRMHERRCTVSNVCLVLLHVIAIVMPAAGKGERAQAQARSCRGPKGRDPSWRKGSFPYP